MHPRVKEFLAVTELDELLALKQTITNLDAEDEAGIISVLQDWQDKQAVANVLMNPQLIPDAVRFHAVLRGLQDKHVDYYRLAATVGLQEFDSDTFSEEECSTIAEQLLALLESNDVIAERASIAIAQYITKADASKLFKFFDHSNDVVKHNIFVSLIQCIGLQEIHSFMSNAIQTGLIPQSVRDVIAEKLHDLEDISKETGRAVRRKLVRSGLGLPLLSYIPNLCEMQTTTLET